MSTDAFADYFAERRKRLQSVRLPYGTPPLTPAQILRLVSDEWLRMDKDEKKVRTETESSDANTLGLLSMVCPAVCRGGCGAPLEAR